MKVLALVSVISATWVSTCLPRRQPYAEVDPSDFATLVVVNESSDRICSVHVAVADARRWGPDQLGDREFVDPQRERVFEVPVGIYDVRLEDCGHDPMMERRHLSVPAEGLRLVFRVREPDPEDEDEEDDHLDAGTTGAAAGAPSDTGPSTAPR